MTIQNTGVTISFHAFGHNDIVNTFTGPNIVSPLLLRSAVVYYYGL